MQSRENLRVEASSSDETKKKKMEDDSHTVQKKQKQEGSSIPSSKVINYNPQAFSAAARTNVFQRQRSL